MPYTGNEQFLVGGRGIHLAVDDFWRWAHSDLASSAERSILAKFIVASSLGLIGQGGDGIRKLPEPYSIISKDGYRVEVKAAAYIQSLDSGFPDHVSFSIASAKSPWGLGGYVHDVPLKHSDVCIFCLYKGQKEWESPLDLDLWDFYLLPSKTLVEQKPGLKTITLPSLMEMGPVWCDYYGIGDGIQKAMAA